MENRSHALMTGIFTLVLLAAAILAGLWFNRDRTERVPFQIVTTQSIPGLNPQATVRYRGLEVGRVDDIIFDPRTTGQCRNIPRMVDVSQLICLRCHRARRPRKRGYG